MQSKAFTLARLPLSLRFWQEGHIKHVNSMLSMLSMKT